MSGARGAFGLVVTGFMTAAVVVDALEQAVFARTSDGHDLKRSLPIRSRSSVPVTGPPSACGRVRDMPSTGAIESS